MGSAVRAWARASLVMAVVIALDQATKAIVRAEVQRGESHDVLGDVVRIVHVRNDGVAFGALAGGGVIVTVVIVAALVALVAYFATHARRPLAWLPTGLLLGGALGNVIDRLHQGAVTDFVKLPSWPAFNVADTCITLGVVVLLFVLERPRRAVAHEA